MSLELNEQFQKVINGLTEKFPGDVIDVYQSTGDTFVRVTPGAIHDVCTYLKEEQHFIYLIDVFGTDRFTSEDRFEVVYNILSLRDRLRLFVKVWLPEEDPEIASVTGIWECADWFERQTYDMFGIRFTGHPDFRRIYMPEDFEYFPMRKEFPLLGIPGSIELPSSTPDPE
ncbi:NADH-quinone oxidoreductase subunit C [Aliifodinibius sp. S!AR15-10]|uniref:NADH-quinone oxidoreductase subunit C n=1 Tax=Aliifodinibius sp. S!AR15-10 TaxID=2950437 RepID=UPI002856AD6A|nr:NADH-quinone oxidoreductase subunit C [Aliifodinibius sp. S!AR15-10]MDR8392360.1 NADH-quinone oxidoreductase subunit C [Aliifodinibius sp. S!AR15-10]